MFVNTKYILGEIMVDGEDRGPDDDHIPEQNEFEVNLW